MRWLTRRGWWLVCRRETGHLLETWCSRILQGVLAEWTIEIPGGFILWEKQNNCAGCYVQVQLVLLDKAYASDLGRDVCWVGNILEWVRDKVQKYEDWGERADCQCFCRWVVRAFEQIKQIELTIGHRTLLNSHGCFVHFSKYYAQGSSRHRMARVS